MTDHDENDELELEPVDPEILEHQRERAKRQARAAEDSVDINEVYEQEDLGDPIDLEQLKQFRFTTRHLLILTAVLAIVMTFYTRLGGCMGLFVSGCIALGAGWWFVLREERRRLAELAEQREIYAERMAARRAREDGEPAPQEKAKLDAEQFQRINEQWESENTAQSSFSFSFSMKEMLITFTVAAVILGLASLLGFNNAALLFGLLALLGLVVQAFGVELPPLLVLGWWLLLVLYILISLVMAFGS